MKNKLVFIISLFALTSCGTKFNKLGAYGMDHSTNWEDNYFTYFDSHLKELNNEVVTLDKDSNKVFTSYSDPNFVSLEERATGDNALSYMADFDETIGYGPNMKLTNSNDFVREGVTSKLFDGMMFCHGYFEAARVQIKEDGFSADFGKKLTSSDYLYLNFKSALDFKSQAVEGHLADVTLKITFYNLESSITYQYPIKDIPTNQGESYIFYGFSLNGLSLNNATSFSISYTLDKDEYNIEKSTNIAHALLLYEFGFKNPIFE